MSELNITLKMTADKQTIKEEIKRLSDMIKVRNSEIALLAKAITHYRNQCDHEGQETGHNERDGSWGNPCPTCGYSY